MKWGPFEFNLRELAGSLGDFGTLLPLAIGYITVCKMNPAGLLVMMGLANISTGLLYRLPMPIEPMKVLAVVAIVGAMMLLVGIEMVKFARDLRFNRHLIPVAVTLGGSLLVNMAIGFAAGMVAHYLLLGKERRGADAQR